MSQTLEAQTLETWTGLSLETPWVLALLPLLAVLTWFGARRPALRFAPSVFLRRDAAGRPRPLPRSVRQRSAWLPGALHVLGLAALLLAWARPYERVRAPHTQTGIDILLVLDVSSSMRADDLQPGRTRLAVVQEAAAAFVARRAEDRIGLVTFARYPDVVCPPTLDHRALLELLARVAPVAEDGEEDATGIGMALARAAQALRHSESPSKVVVLLTDGEENVARADSPKEIAPLEAARLCQEWGVRVYTIVAGIGRRSIGGRWQELDTKPVREAATLTSGGFFETRDAGSVQRVYAMIDSLERSAFDVAGWERQDRFAGFLLAGLALLLAARAARTAWFEALP